MKESRDDLLMGLEQRAEGDGYNDVSNNFIEEDKINTNILVDVIARMQTYISIAC